MSRFAVVRRRGPAWDHSRQQGGSSGDMEPLTHEVKLEHGLTTRSRPMNSACSGHASCSRIPRGGIA